MKRCLPFFHDWEDLGLFQNVSIIWQSPHRWRVFRCRKCDHKRETFVPSI